MTINLGETTVTANADGGITGILVMYLVTVAKPATIQAMSIYFGAVGGNSIMGIYDNTGTSGNPGALVASCAQYVPVIGWNTRSVTAPRRLQATNYYLAFMVDSGLAGPYYDSTGTMKYWTGQSFALPATAPASPNGAAQHHSLYALLDINRTNQVFQPSMRAALR